jgi:hypothetical protein
MSKDFAFLFYPNDWLGGTMHMHRVSRACYFDLLMLQFNRGAFTLDEARECLGLDFDRWELIKDKFICENSKYYNERLMQEINKRQKFARHQKDNIQKRWNKFGMRVGNTTVLPLENENEKENEIKNDPEEGMQGEKHKKFIPPTFEQVDEYCKERKNGIDAQAFVDHYQTRGWVPKGYTQQMRDWKAAVRTWEKNNKARSIQSESVLDRKLREAEEEEKLNRVY